MHFSRNRFIDSFNDNCRLTEVHGKIHGKFIAKIGIRSASGDQMSDEMSGKMSHVQTFVVKNASFTSDAKFRPWRAGTLFGSLK